MCPLSDKEFSARLLSEPTVLGKIKLAIAEDRVTIATRGDKPNWSEEFLQPILSLSEKHIVNSKKRKSGGTGFPQVHETTYEYRLMGLPIQIYFKGYFKKKGNLVVELEVQSLRGND
jgi:hypothetical protein